MKKEKKIDTDNHGKQTAKSNINGTLSPKKLLSKKNDSRGYSIQVSVGYCIVENSLRLVFFCGGKVCTFTEKLNCEKCNGLQILLNFLNINLEKVLHLSSVHSSLVDYLIQAIA